MLDLLTPVVKTYASEMGILSTSLSIQCFGGYGYCEDFPVEQHFRDMRIHAIHEGTTGIQGMDLLGRKVVMKDGQAFMLFLDEVQAAMDAAIECGLDPFVEQLGRGLQTLQDVTVHLIAVAQEKGPEFFLATTAQNALKTKLTESENNFYQGKLFTFRFFYGYELVKINSLAERLMNPDAITVEMKSEYFSD